MGHVKRKHAFEQVQNVWMHAQGLIWVFVLRWYILRYPMILAAKALIKVRICIRGRLHA